METKYKQGDVLQVHKSGGVKHFGIYIGSGNIIDNSPSLGRVSIRSLRDFSPASKINVLKHQSKYTGFEIVERAMQRLGRPYNILTQNCEHFVTDVILGRPSSKQINTLIVTALLGLGIYALTKKH